MTDEVPETEVADTADTPVAEVDEPKRGGLLASKRFIAAVAAATVAFIVAAVLGVLWYTTTTSGEYEVAVNRDDAAAVAREAVLAYTSIDYKNPDNFRNSQRAVSTDDLNDQMEKGWTNARKQIVENKILVKVRVLDVGVDEMDTHKGNADAMAVIKISKETPGKPKDEALMRMIVKLKRVGDEWKLTDIGNAPEIGA